MNVYLKRWDSDAFTVDLSSIQFQHTHTKQNHWWTSTSRCQSPDGSLNWDRPTAVNSSTGRWSQKESGRHSFSQTHCACVAAYTRSVHQLKHCACVTA